MNVAIFTKNWIGDVVFLEPAIRVMKRNFPEATLFAICPKRCVPVLEANPNVAGVITFDDRREDKSLFSKWKLIQKLKRLGVERIYLFHRSWSRALIAKFAGIQERIGYDTKSRGFLLSHAIPEPENHAHSVDYFLELLGASGLDISDEQIYRFYFLEEDRLRIQSLLSEFKLEPKKLIALNPGANWLPKRWPVEYFRDLACELVKRYGVQVVVTGNSQDQALGNIVQNGEARTVISLCGKTTLRELGALYATCRLLISGDSGPLHIGAGVGTNVIGLFGPTDPKLTGPRGPGHNVVLHYVPPNERVPWHGKRFPFGQWMERITVRQVLDAI